MIQQEGPGWRLARDPQRHPYGALIGGETWAVELTESEAGALASLIQDLVDHHAALRGQLMDEELITLELERTPWWGSLEGDREGWSLQMILRPEDGCERGVEVFWPAPAAAAVAAAMRTLWDFSTDQLN